ncbi:MAG: UDP-glucose/GDP-mannose dehydrogenase family protein [Chitinophagaceae bacterium]|nr:UDP-glucose/GDP-mannose dehydrogenase family protein [Chitinophagaceae bacterium]
MKIAVIGTGYVGLVSGTCFAETGNDVTCVDIDKSKVEKLTSGKITIYEPDLERLFIKNLKEDRLHFTTSLVEGISEAKIIILALPTPSGGDGNADLQYILGVAKEIGENIRKDDYKVILDKSTVPVGTAEKVRHTIIKSANNKIDISNYFEVVSNPEFLREGVAVDDFMKPDRIIIGTTSEKAKKILELLYAPFIRQSNRIIYMDERSAELTKYAANSFLATKISFMNELSQLCEKVGANIDMVRRGMGSDERIGSSYLFPGIGYGGSCFPKDVKALAQSSNELDYDFKILDAVMKVNEKQKLHLLPKLKKYFNDDLKGKRIALWGLAFKPNTDDIREASALAMIDEFINEGAIICAFDPEAMENVINKLGDTIEYAKNQYDALKNADALVIATEWSEFRTPDFNRIASLLNNKAIFDGRNLFDLKQMKECGFHYESIGRMIITNKK